MLGAKLRGHDQYYGMRGNFRRREEVRRFVEQAWRYWVSRRSSKSTIGWKKFGQLRQTSILPLPRIVHHI
jgi:RNA-directed DNA polymerase